MGFLGQIKNPLLISRRLVSISILLAASTFFACSGQNSVITQSTLDELSASQSAADSVTTGRFHTCAVIRNVGDQRTVKCWGNNVRGQLGNHNVFQSNTPTLVEGIPDSPVSISSQFQHTCAVLRSGDVYCWGANGGGQLGNNSKLDSFIPVKMQDLKLPAISVAAGMNHTCVLLKNGEVYCVGKNEYGQLGNGTAIESQVPHPVSNLDEGVTQIASSSNTVCAVLKNGQIKCWGRNSSGQLGNQLQNDSSTPVLVKNLKLKASSVSVEHGTACAVLVDGSIQCWGNNNFGQLGNGTTVHSLSPVTVKNLNDTAISLTAGNGAFCALTQSLTVKCWGAPYGKTFGNDSIDLESNILSPVEVKGSMGQVTGISMNHSHTCGIWDHGTLKCWGENEYGQLGNGSFTDSILPDLVSGI